jgi:hypothetical protein
MYPRKILCKSCFSSRVSPLAHAVSSPCRGACPSMSPEIPRLDNTPRVTAAPSFHTIAKPSRRGWLYASVPALFLFGLVVVARPIDYDSSITSLSQARATGVGLPPIELAAQLERGILPVSSTYVVTSGNAIAGTPSADTPNVVSTSGAVLRGRLEKNADVRGRAPLTGQVSRVMVRPGQRVDVNDRVIEISTGPTTRVPLPSESKQSAAESAQVRAVNRQTQLQQKMSAAQELLVDAQERVDAARRRVDQARDIVARLQRGETVNMPSEASQQRERDVAPRRSSEVSPSVQRERQQALRAAEEAQKAAERAEDKATAADIKATSLENTVKPKDRAVQEARSAVERAQKSFDAGTIKASELDAARAAVEDAEIEFKNAQNAAQTARKAEMALSSAAREAKQVAEKARGRVAKSLEKLQVFASNTPAEKRSEPAPTDHEEARAVTIQQAAKLVGDAVRESEAAAAEARRIKSQVDDYERQVRQTQAQLSTSSERLESVQEEIMDQTIQANLSVVRAPASGTILTVANVAQEVREGDVIITIGKGTAMAVRWTDTSGSWRSLKEDQRVSVSLQAALPVTGTTPAEIGKIGALPNSAVLSPGTSIQASARIREITAPARPGAPAVIEAVVANNLQNGRPTLAEGMIALYSPVSSGTTGVSTRAGTDVAGGAPVAGSSNAIPVTIPADAILPDGRGYAQVAVLQPNGDNNVNQHRIEWRQVTLGNTAGGQQEIASGLLPGERIALQPGVIRSFELRQGSDLSLRLVRDV